jgi:flagellar L-ring protein precursor FlgH
MIQKLRWKSIVSLLILLLVLACSTTASASSSGDKKKKKQAEEAKQAALRVVEVKPTRPPTPPANGSLFTDSASGASLVTNFKAQRVGDLVFIDVIETSTATVSSSATRSRDSGTVAGLAGAVAALPSASAAVVSGVMTGLGQRKYDGKGATQRQSDFRSRITARVVEVLPNGDLRIEASKLVKINKEDETLSLSGIVRQRDVSSDNDIPSTLVGDLRLALNGKGVASADNQPGWLFRLIDKVSPF